MARKTETDPKTKTRILDAAEHAFSDHGFAGASLRNIVQEAKVNLPTVYYYFESKEGLLSAVMDRRFGPIREQSFKILRELDIKAKGRPLELEKILEAIIAPALDLATDKSSAIAMRLLGRIVTDPHVQRQS